MIVCLQASRPLAEFYYLPSSCASCSSPDPGHYCGNRPGGPERNTLGEGCSSSVVSDENCRVSVGCVTFSLDLEYLLDVSVKIHFLCAGVNLLVAKNISASDVEHLFY